MRSGNRGYKLTYTDQDEKRGEFLVHLVKVRGHMFLDLFPDGPHLEESDFYVIHLVPAHTFMHVKQIKPTLQMRMLDAEWLQDLLKEHPGAVKHERLEDQTIVLTAKPKELQTFLIKHLDTEGAFSEFSDMQPTRSADEERPNTAMNQSSKAARELETVLPRERRPTDETA